MKKKIFSIIALSLAVIMASCNKVNESIIPSTVDTASFTSYLEEKKNYLNGIDQSTLSNSEKLLLWNALDGLSTISYNENLTMEENLAAIDSILKDFMDATYDPIGNETLYFTGNFLGIVGFNLTLFPDYTFTVDKISYFGDDSSTFTGTYTYVNKKITTIEDQKEIEHLCNDVPVTEKDGKLVLYIVDGAVEMVQTEKFQDSGHEDTASLALMPNKKAFVQSDTLSAVKPKTDVILNLGQTLEFTDEFKTKLNSLDSTLKTRIQNITKNDDIYVETMSSFRQNGEYVSSSTFTPLGSELMEALGYDLLYGNTIQESGIYEITSSDNYLYNVDVTLANQEKIHYVYDEESKTLYRNQIFKEESFDLYSFADILTHAGGNFEDTKWSEGVDGTSYVDVRYGDRERELFDIYIPKNLDKTHENGVYLLIHGGSWTSGSKEEMTNECYYYAKKGFITATLSYTYAATDLGGGEMSGFQTMVDEITMCFEKIKEMSIENGWNITKAATYGYSSGGHISLLYSYMVGSQQTAVFPSAFAVSFVGPTDFGNDCWDEVGMWGPGIGLTGLAVDVDEIFVNYDENADISQLELKISQQEFEDLFYEASPCKAASKYGFVPTIGAYGMSDFSVVSGYHGIKIKNTLDSLGCDNNIYYMPSGDHLSGHNPAIQELFKNKILEYLNLYF